MIDRPPTGLVAPDGVVTAMNCLPRAAACPEDLARMSRWVCCPRKQTRQEDEGSVLRRLITFWFAAAVIPCTEYE